MASPKKKKSSPAAILKRKGLIPKSYDLKNLTPGQKSWVTKQTRAFSQVVKNPSAFTTISASTRKQKTQARSAGLPISNGRALVKGTSARRTKTGQLVVRGNGRTNTVFFLDSKNWHQQLKAAKAIKLKPNQVWKLRMGGEESFTDLNTLQLYALQVTSNDEEAEEGKYASLTLVELDTPTFVQTRRPSL